MIVHFNWLQAGSGHSLFDVNKQIHKVVKSIVSCRSPLVPVFGFGQNSLFHLFGSYDSSFYKFQKWMHKKTKCGISGCYGYGLIPFRTPLNVVGKCTTLWHLCD